MKLLKPGDPCPCCGRPIKEGLPTGTMIFLSWLAEGMALREAAKSGEDGHAPVSYTHLTLPTNSRV